MERRGPDSDAETLAFFAEYVGQHSQSREDIKTWFEAAELDAGRHIRCKQRSLDLVHRSGRLRFQPSPRSRDLFFNDGGLAGELGEMFGEVSTVAGYLQEGQGKVPPAMSSSLLAGDICGPG